VRGVPQRLSAAWTFVVFNYLYCDVIGLMDPGLLRQLLTGRVNGLSMGAGLLLGASILMELPIAMVLVSRVARYRVNRWANLTTAGVMTAVQVATLFTGPPKGYYVFFSAVEIVATAAIAYVAWTWRLPQPTAEDVGEPVDVRG
jgi:hypothetical protein